ncbi:PDK repeat-containing protein [Thermoplasmatales archaeon SCGC AB-540-F20]|nr:PDK repeat-containing protein [Thermoplasmatales archaeon SCGC AB-540-F20]
MKRFLSLLLFLFFLSNLVAIASDGSTIIVEDVEIEGIGNTGTTNIILDTIPNGLSGFNISISINNPSVFNIISVTFPSWATIHSNSSLPASYVWLKAADMNKQIEAGATNIVFVTLNLESTQIGEASIDILITKISDDNGYPIEPSIVNGSGNVVRDHSSNGNGNGDNGGGGVPPTNQAPIADASAGEPYQGFVSEEITFDGSLSFDPDEGDVLSWFWEFGDGENEIGEISKHRYSSPGTYNVILTVSDDSDAEDSYNTTAIISQPNKIPSAPDISGPGNGTKNVLYTYTAVSIDRDNETLQYVIDWGDGQTNITEFFPNGTAVILKHIWTAAGKYTISVQVYDNQTISNTTNFMVLIDTYIVGDIGYITDDDADGIYDTFYGETAQTMLEQVGEIYLIDINGDGEWDHTYDLMEGLMTYQKEEIEIPLIMIIGIVIIIVTIASSIYLYRREYF